MARKKTNTPKAAKTGKGQKKSSAVSPNAVKTSTPPSRDNIAVAAYFRWQSRGCSDGQDLNDWIEAEKELTSC